MMHQLRYTLELRRPAVIAAQAENPNLVTSLGYVPGSSLLGAAAAAFIANPANNIPVGKAHLNRDFARYFLRGGLSFLNAYPTDEAGHRLLPAPLSLLTDKSEENEVYDLSNEARLVLAQKEGKRLVAISEYVDCAQDSVRGGEPRKRLRYHHARPNRLKGRPDENEGSLFVYEAMEAEQYLTGRILGKDTDLRAFLTATQWSAGDVTLWFGRSRTAEYGGDAVLHFETQIPEPFTCEFADASSNGGLTAGPLVVTLLSPMINRDAQGRHCVFPFEELQLALQGSGLTLENGGKDMKAFCRQMWVGGYARIWNLPRPQLPAFAPGSVFVIETTGRPDPNFIPATAEAVSLGERTGEGYGRFALNWHTPLGIHEKGDPLTLKSVMRQRGETLPEMFLHIYRENRRRLLLDAARSRGLTDGDSFRPLGPEEGVAASQLGRVIHTLRNTAGLDTLRDLLDNLRSPAKRQFEASSYEGKTLLATLCLYKDNPTAIRSKLTVPTLEGIVDLPNDAQLGASDEELARIYLLSLCSELAWKKRTNGNGGTS